LESRDINDPYLQHTQENLEHLPATPCLKIWPKPLLLGHGLHY
jgi:hypothetical protein